MEHLNIDSTVYCNSDCLVSNSGGDGVKKALSFNGFEETLVLPQDEYEAQAEAMRQAAAKEGEAKEPGCEGTWGLL